MTFNYINNDYSKTIKNTQFGYFTKSEMKAKYPAGGYKIAGQLCKGKEEIGFLKSESEEISVFKTQNSLAYKIVGFVEIGENQFLAVIKSNLPNIILYLVLLALVIVAVILGASRCSKPAGNESGATNNASIEEGIVLPDDLTTVAHLETDGKNIQIPGTPTVIFKADTKEQTHIFSNPEGNPCYFKIQIVLDDTGEMIYESNMIPPGYSVQNIKLTKSLSAGTYSATINYLTYSFDSELNELNNAVVNTKLVVE